METLAHVRAVATTQALPDWAVGAGFVRNAVWDHLHDRAPMTPLADIDVLFFDRHPKRCDPAFEREMEAELRTFCGVRPWSVRNQARMHTRNGDAPYASTSDAMTYWLETPTAVAVRLLADDKIELLAPYGLDDLFACRARPTPAGRRKPGQYASRMTSKAWPKTWWQVVVTDIRDRPARPPSRHTGSEQP